MSSSPLVSRVKSRVRQIVARLCHGWGGLDAQLEIERLKALLDSARQEYDRALVSYKIKPDAQKVLVSPPNIDELDDGYLNDDLNAYIISKAEKWLRELDTHTLVLPPHVVAILFVLEYVGLQCSRRIDVVDFGGGAPTISMLASHFGVPVVNRYSIIENPSFLRHVPQSWGNHAKYFESVPDSRFDLLIVSSVFPYISEAQQEKLLDDVAVSSPEYVYFGRTAFLRDDYPEDTVYTVQSSRYKDHGPQVETDLKHLESRVATYARRHHKRSALEKWLALQGYRRVFSLTDDSGLENIEGLGLYADNSLWRRPTP